MGSVLRRAGISVQHGTPDLVANWDGQDFFIEAKRPASPKRLDDRLRSAVHQIRRLARPGIVAICADQLLRPSGGLMAVATHDDLAQKVDDLLVSFILGHGQMLRNRLEGEPVAALLWTARLPARIDSTGHWALGTSLRLEMLLPGTREVDFASATMSTYLCSTRRRSPYVSCLTRFLLPPIGPDRQGPLGGKQWRFRQAMSTNWEVNQRASGPDF